LNSPTIQCGCVVNFKASRSFSPAIAIVIYPRMPEPRCDSQEDFHLDLTLNLSAGAFHLRVWGRVFHDALHSNRSIHPLCDPAAPRTIVSAPIVAERIAL
jgi:hypothetical protein